MTVTEKQLQNLKNRKTFKSGEKAVRCGRMGGIRSGESKREKKTMRECVKLFSELSLNDLKEIADLEEQGIGKDDMTQAMALTTAMFAKAKRGNSQMARLLMELLGQVKEQQTNVNVTTNVNPYASLTEEELRKIADDDG